MKVSEHIDIRELVDKKTYLLFGDKCVDKIDPRLPVILERIRQLCGGKAMTINDWHIGGKLQYRGFRPSDCAVGAVKSMHKQGKAADFDIKGLSADKVRNIIRENAAELLKLGLTRIETNISWVHIDLKYTGYNYIYEFRP